jgi:hypothetical protein
MQEYALENLAIKDTVYSKNVILCMFTFNLRD